VAAQEISGLASESVGRAERAGGLLDALLPSIHRTADLVQEISAASKEQASGLEQINSAVTQLSKTTHTGSSSAEELSATAEEVSSQALQLQGLMQHFKVENDQSIREVPAPRFTRKRAESRGARGKQERGAEAAQEPDFEPF
jgi:methyl-accepting chemotaxis protein